MACSGPVLLVFAALISLSSARAVNISNTWMLPEEGFPVFYRYFRDRISWYEADAVCQFHHANLVTADSTSQYDAIRAYLKELDITDNVWIGLSKTSEKPKFTWTDFRPLNGDGHWQEAIPKVNDPICVAMDPAADFLWKSLACGGPEVASFICELPIPSWALGPRGCLLTELPSLTVLYIPEQSALELTSDCGLDGTKRIACKGNADREEILKQLTCAISHEDFDEKTTKTPIASSTVYETSSDENSFNSKTTKTWIWTSNTVDIDYGMPTRHRRETEDTLSPISTKSTAGLSTANGSFRKKLTTPESFTTSATNYDTEVTTGSLENDSTLDSSVSKSSYKSTGFNETRDGLTTQDINTRPEEQAEMISTATTATAESKMTETVEETAAEYPSAINQGQLFSIIENGTMFDIIELNESNSDPNLRKPQEDISTQENVLNTVTTKAIQKPLSTAKNNEAQTDTTSSTIKSPTKLEKPTKKDLYKYSSPKKGSKQKESTKSEEKQTEQILTKEVELYPIIKDSSIKLNRTFRKDLPPMSDENTQQDEDPFGRSKLINLSINNDLSNAVGEHVEIKLRGEGTDNITGTLFITTRKHSEKSKEDIDPNNSVVAKTIEALIDPERQMTEIDPKLEVLNMNLTKSNDSETIETEKLQETPELIMKKQFLPKSLLGEIETTDSTADYEGPGASKDPLENELAEQPRPNRQRQLTRPQRRSFYPYFFSRVLG